MDDALDIKDVPYGKIDIWDTAGAERFNALTNNYFRGLDVVIFVRDASDYNDCDAEAEGKVQTLFESLDLDDSLVKVEIMYMKSDLIIENAELYKEARNFFSKYEPMKIQSFILSLARDLVWEKRKAHENDLIL